MISPRTPSLVLVEIIKGDAGESLPLPGKFERVKLPQRE
jgi:hypothetical protein